MLLGCADLFLDVLQLVTWMNALQFKFSACMAFIMSLSLEPRVEPVSPKCSKGCRESFGYVTKRISIYIYMYRFAYSMFFSQNILYIYIIIIIEISFWRLNTSVRSGGSWIWSAETQGAANSRKKRLLDGRFGGSVRSLGPTRHSSGRLVQSVSCRKKIREFFGEVDAVLTVCAFRVPLGQQDQI